MVVNAIAFAMETGQKQGLQCLHQYLVSALVTYRELPPAICGWE